MTGQGGLAVARRPHIEKWQGGRGAGQADQDELVADARKTSSLGS